MIKIINESTSKDQSVYLKILTSVVGDLAQSEPYRNYGTGDITIDISPDDESINKVIASAESKGFKEVDRYIDSNFKDDSYVVLTRERDDRVVIGIVFNASNDYAFVIVTCGYKEEYSDYFESLKNSHLDEDWRDGKFTKEDLDEYISSIDEKVDLIEYSLKVMTKKHPEFYDEFVSEVKSIRNKFDNLQSYL